MGWSIAVLMLLCPALVVTQRYDSVPSVYNREGAKLTAFKEWKQGNRALITGTIMFTDDPAQPLDLIITTIETNIPQDMYCNQVVLGNAFFGSDEIKERKNNNVAVKIGTSLDNSDVVTWLFMEAHESRKAKLSSSNS